MSASGQPVWPSKPRAKSEHRIRGAMASSVARAARMEREALRHVAYLGSEATLPRLQRLTGWPISTTRQVMRRLVTSGQLVSQTIYVVPKVGTSEAVEEAKAMMRR